MIANTELNDGFNWWLLLANLGALVALALLPYLVFIGTLVVG
ncbi:MAG: hypothetical protein WA981_09745 [Glaciecola sp.]